MSELVVLDERLTWRTARRRTERRTIIVPYLSWGYNSRPTVPVIRFPPEVASVRVSGEVRPSGAVLDLRSQISNPPSRWGVVATDH